MSKHLLTAALVVASAWSVFAAKVVSVSVKTADGKTENSGDILARCQLKVGDEYDAGQCARDVKALRDSGEFDEITAEAEPVGNGVEVVYIVKRKMRFHGPLNVKGNEEWNASKIASFADLRDGYAYGEADFAAAAGRIRKEYLKKFYPDVKVTPVIEPAEGLEGAVNVTMNIEEGERVKIHNFKFTGNKAFSGKELREAFDQYPWWNPLGWFSEKPATELGFAEACDKIRTFYRDNGYLDATVAMPEPVVRADGRTDRLFKIVEGPLYKVGSMKVTGTKQYPADVVLQANKTLKTGDIAGAAAMDAAAKEIEVFCGSGEKALCDTRVIVQQVPSKDDPAVLDLTFSVIEGVKVKINRILVRGNDYTKDKVIRREITLSPGDPMLADKAEQSKRKLENLRYFERVRYYMEPVDTGLPRASGMPEERDLIYEVAEKNTGNFMVGIGASSVDSVYGTVELSEANFDLFNPWRFRGAGQKGRILIQAGPRYQSYEASVTEPHLFDRLLEFTVEGYRRQRWYDDYDIIRNGAAATISYPVKFWPTAPTFGRLGFRLAAEFIEFDDVEDDLYWDDARQDRFPFFKEEEERYGDNWEIPLRVFWENDTRDSFIFPKRGYRTQIYGDLVGGDNEYWRFGFNYRQYLTVWKKYNHVLSFGLRGETVDAFSGDLPIYDRLFLGGPRSIRGVDYREIAPRIWALEGKKGKYAPWGGQTSWCFNMEYTVPIVKYVRVAAFTDMGSVGEDDFDLGTDWFCWSVGLGLRLDIESFPIRLDFAVPVVDPDDDVDEQVFSFTVGYDF